MSRSIDIAANRAAQKWTRSELLRRACWEVFGQLFFAWTPRQFWVWRRMVLRVFGAKIGTHVHIHATVRVQIPWNLSVGDYSAIGDRAIIYNLGVVTIGRNATVSQNAHLCAGTHDYRTPDLPLIKAPIEIGEGVWICADAFIGPGVSIGAHAIVGARAVAIADISAWTIVAGNPAKPIRQRPPFPSTADV